MEKLEREGFVACFVLGPTISASILPTMFFGVVLGESGSNLLWGSYFGLGWCLSAFWSGQLVHDSFSSRVGFAWGWLAIVPLYFAARHLCAKLDGSGRELALRVLFVSLLLDVPTSLTTTLDQTGLHLPDYTLHLAGSF